MTREAKGGSFHTEEITKDQSCLTAYNKQLKLLGVACGNGTTYLVKASNLAVIGKEQKHGFVITGGTISRGGRFVTGNFSIIQERRNAHTIFNNQMNRCFLAVVCLLCQYLSVF